MKLLACIPLLLSCLTVACGKATSVPATSTPVTVRTTVARTTALPRLIEAGGVVRPRQSAEVASRVLAPVVAVHVKVGDRVSRGATLLSLEASEAVAAAARTRATLLASEQNTRAAEGAVASAQTAFTLARVTHERMRTLYDKRSATRQELDEAAAAFDNARAQVSSAEASFAAAVASSRAAGAAVDAAQAALAYTRLTAPFDGIVTERSVDPGDMATPGARLLTVEDAAALRLEVSVDEARAADAARSSKVRVALAAESTAERETRVDATLAETGRLTPGSRSVILKLDLPRSVRLPSGTFGRAFFEGPTRQALVVPAGATVRRGQLTFVYLVADNDQARLQPVSLGARMPDQVEVLAGLRAGDRVVIQPPPALADGARIREEAR